MIMSMNVPADLNTSIQYKLMAYLGLNRYLLLSYFICFYHISRMPRHLVGAPLVCCRRHAVLSAPACAIDRNNTKLTNVYAALVLSPLSIFDVLMRTAP